MKTWLYPLCCVTILSVLSACGTNTDSAEGTHAGPHTQNTTYQLGHIERTEEANTYQGTGVMPDRGQLKGIHFNPVLAKQISEAADNVPSVDGATTVVRGNEAVVAINHRFSVENVTQRQVVERQVYATVRAVAPTHNIRLTSDTSMYMRVRNFNDKLTMFHYGGRVGSTATTTHVASLGQEFANLVRDVK